MYRTLALLASVVVLTAVLSACNTIAGVGKDVKATGGAVEKAAEQSKPK